VTILKEKNHIDGFSLFLWHFFCGKTICQAVDK